jgi:aspartate/methionine/tyrosine aminotransferase
MRDFGLEVYFSQWEFSARHHMTASDSESMTVSDLLAMGTPDQVAGFHTQRLGYTHSRGDPELRAQIASTYDHMAADNILCLAGAGEGLYLVPKVLLNSGDHAIVPTPNYQGSETVPLSVCEVSGVPLRRDTNAKSGWRLDIDDIKAAIRRNTKLLSLNFPQNPTGILIPHADLEELIVLCRSRGIYIFCDEVYRGVELDLNDQLPQIADVYEKGISLNVLSKAYGLPALRIGWIASQDKELLLKAEHYKHYLSVCNSGPSESLALIALNSKQKILQRNRELLFGNVVLLEALFNDYPGLFEWHRPLGGCVAFPRYKGPDGGEEFCRKLIEESGVLLLPSSLYKSDLADIPKDHFRIGFGRDQIFKEGLTAMRQHLEKNYANFFRG